MKFLKLAVVVLALVGLGVVSSSIGLAQKTITVCPEGCDYSKIQDAIDAAAEGDTIEVQGVTQAESVVITKRITLLWAGGDSTILKNTDGITITYNTQAAIVNSIDQNFRSQKTQVWDMLPWLFVLGIAILVLFY